VTNVEGLHKQLQEFVDKAVKVGYIRSAARHVIEVTPKKSALAVMNLQGNQLVVNESARFWLGIGLANVDATLRSQLNIPDSEGLVVTSVEADSPSSKAGVMVNDVLLKLDGKALKAIEELSASLQEIGEKSVTLELLRRGKSATLSVTPQKHPQGNLSYQVTTPAVEMLTFTIPDKAAWAGNSESGIAQLRAAMEMARMTPTASRNARALAADPTQKDLAAQITKVLAQTRQLQGSLETLLSEIKDSKATTTNQEPKPAKP
jgi:membrane-associated protease RseP (regulator of RpoE activity)